MKILQVSNFFKPLWETGGVTRVCYLLSVNLAKRGHDVTVYTTEGYKYNTGLILNQSVEMEGIKVYYFRNLFKKLIKKMSLTTPYYLPFVLRKEIKSFDVIHLHEHRTLSAVIIYYYAKKHSVPYILQSHGSVLPFLQKQKLKKFFDFLIGYKILKYAREVIALNETESSQYEKMGVSKDKIKVVPNAIDIDDFKHSSFDCFFRSKYLISPKSNIILYVGRLHRSKGLDLLIKSFSILLRKLPDSKLVLVGPDSGFQKELEELAKELKVEKNILFTGFVNKKEKISALREASIFVTPTFTGFPISFLEACVFGVPIVTTDEGDYLDWINSKVGFVVKYDEHELSKAMLTILTDDSLRRNFSIEGKSLVENKFSIDSFISEIESIYINVSK